MVPHPSRIAQHPEIDDIRNTIRLQLSDAIDQKRSVKEAIGTMAGYADARLASG